MPGIVTIPNSKAAAVIQLCNTNVKMKEQSQGKEQSCGSHQASGLTLMTEPLQQKLDEHLLPKKTETIKRWSQWVVLLAE